MEVSSQRRNGERLRVSPARYRFLPESQAGLAVRVTSLRGILREKTGKSIGHMLKVLQMKVLQGWS